MVKLNKRNVRIIYPIFLFVLGAYVGQQLHSATPQPTFPNDLISNHIEVRSYKNVDSVNSNQISTLLHNDLNTDDNIDLKTLLRLNTEQIIRNIEKFPLKLGNDSVVLLVQVHNRLEDLKILIESLRRVRYINESLLVFSHDLYSKSLFEVIQSIDFCPVLQLFFPYSIQFHGKSFPGDATEDCPSNLERAYLQQKGSSCYNVDFYDSFGHYREGRVTQTKHHWVWKQHFVFDRLRVLRDYQGTVLRVEDDYYVAEDTIHVIKALDKVQSVACPECLMYILGDREFMRLHKYTVNDIDVVKVLPYSTNIGRGMAYRAQFWRKLKSCARTFCHFDDYNWDWTLQHTSVDCIKGFKVLKPKASRVFHIGACQGFHKHNSRCNNTIMLGKALNVIDKYKQSLYPGAFKVVKDGGLGPKQNNGNGGWADPRDHLLCMKLFQNKTDNANLLSEINKIISMY